LWRVYRLLVWALDPNALRQIERSAELPNDRALPKEHKVRLRPYTRWNFGYERAKVALQNRWQRP
jgi:hypothetical protein